MRYILPLTLILSFPAYAQQAPKCGPVAEVQKMLKERYNETPVSYGIVNPRAVVEVYVSPEGKTWTLLAIGVEGMACFVATGKDWVTEEPEDKGI